MTTFRRAMRLPLAAFVALVLLLGAIVALGAIAPGHATSFIVIALAGAMVGTILLFTMEVAEEPPLMRFYAILGFCWLGVLMGMTMLDYLTR